MRKVSPLWVVISVLLFGICILLMLRTPKSTPGEYHCDTIWKDTGTHTVVLPPPTPVTEIPPKDTFYIVDRDTIFADDSLLYFLLTELYTIKSYDDTIVNDSCLTIRLKETLERNAISSRSVEYRTRCPTTIITPVQSCNRIHLGLEVGKSPKAFGIAPVLQVTHGKRVFGVSYDLLSKDVYLKYLWQIY